LNVATGVLNYGWVKLPHLLLPARLNKSQVDVVFACSMVLGNIAYLHLGLAFIQMIKAGLPPVMSSSLREV